MKKYNKNKTCCLVWNSDLVPILLDNRVNTEQSFQPTFKYLLPYNRYENNGTSM